MKKLHIIISSTSLLLLGTSSVFAEENITDTQNNPEIVETNSSTSTQILSATDDPTIVLSSSDTIETDLKDKLISDYISSSAILDDTKVDKEASSLTLSSYNPLSNEVQTIKANLILKNKNGKELAKYSKTISIRIDCPEGIKISVLNPTFYINYGDAFVYTSNLSIQSDSTGNLPVINETDNVDINKEGTYTCNIQGTNAKGDTAKVSYQVVVKKTEAQLQEEQRIKEQKEKEEAERKAEAERLEQQKILAEQQAQQAQARLQAAQLSPIATAGGTSDIVNYARQFIGCPYVWGGNDPSTGVDCSGFTKYVFAHFGITLNRIASDQAANGVQVSVENAQPGDLVIWSGHVGIYSGNGMMVNAENPGVGVRESSISNFMSGSSGYFMGYYRVIN